MNALFRTNELSIYNEILNVPPDPRQHILVTILALAFKDADRALIPKAPVRLTDMRRSRLAT